MNNAVEFIKIYLNEHFKLLELRLCENTDDEIVYIYINFNVSYHNIYIKVNEEVVVDGHVKSYVVVKCFDKDDENVVGVCRYEIINNTRCNINIIKQIIDSHVINKLNDDKILRHIIIY